MVDEENVAAKVAKDLAGKIGKGVITGNISALRGISTPAYVHSSMSYLDTVVYEAVNLEHFCRKAMTENADPIKTIQYLLCSRLANASCGVT
jgi:hypothetical protein